MSEDRIIIKTPAQIAKIRAAGKLAAAVLDEVAARIEVGVSTGDIDRWCAATIAAAGASSAPLNYHPRGRSPFPKSVCTSVNHQVCHGIPSDDKELVSGDVVNVDVTVILDGLYGDVSRMFIVGQPSLLGKRLCDASWECLQRGIEAVRPGAPFGDIGNAIQAVADRHGFSVVQDYCGHGVGLAFHEPPQVLHYGNNHSVAIMEPGMVFTIEPMINRGGQEVKTLADGWTVVTRDRTLSAQWEHTISVSAVGADILTK